VISVGDLLVMMSLCMEVMGGRENQIKSMNEWQGRQAGMMMYMFAMQCA